MSTVAATSFSTVSGTSPGSNRLVSTAGGTEPLWSPNGRELFYREGNTLMVVAVTNGGAFSVGIPEALFGGTYTRNAWSIRDYDILPDGQQFVMIQNDPESTPTHMNVVLNWFNELERLVPTK